MIERLREVLQKCYNDVNEIRNRPDNSYKRKMMDLCYVISGIRNLVYQYVDDIEQDNLRLREQYDREEPWIKIEEQLSPFDVEVLFWNDYRKQIEITDFSDGHPDTSEPDKFKETLKKYRYTHWQRVNKPRNF
ncbi:hypothetical protein ACI49Z_000302 [Cronobacter turicensis]|uniref:hypothetical protein n=1 Tax=Cronobacter turicensis TaxID=413502 RepID=UPI001E1AC765|nr:hypothetical protein [Cronobacter turicensis]EGT5682629.1 hypothetical protein [Cronobacter turicensis]EGT5741499.1 hypothetical protein [Cronobacter turicensis]ELY6319751.1 hypothetical protein [Cronobacter turicensis]MDI6433066.1 hypothetical protein [Cronobacter turicensis]